MIVSFDIDDTLVSSSPQFKVEPTTLLSRIIGGEKIRKGTIQLFRDLESNNHKIWIYTTSFRSQFYLKKMFFAYGLKPKRFINERINRKELKRMNCEASKHPGLFGIDIHVDDSIGVIEEGRRFGFKTIHVTPSDTKWAEKIIERIELEELDLPNKFEQLLITLIALKSPYQKQREMLGSGELEDELADDFEMNYTRCRKELIEFEYLQEDEMSQLDAIEQFFVKKSEEKDTEFWEGIMTHPEWERIRLMAMGVLSSLNHSELDVIIEKEEKMEGEIIIQRIQIKLDRK